MHLHASYPITAERKRDLERHYGACSVLYGGAVGQPTWADTPLTYTVPEWVWDKTSDRYRWRRGMVKDGRNVSWNFHPVPRQEKEAYEARLRRRREDRAVLKKGNRLKNR